MEAEENFLKKIKRRATREKKKKYKEMVMTLRKLRKQLKEKCEEIQPPAEYFEAIDEVLRRDEEDLFEGWEPMLVFPRDFCRKCYTNILLYSNYYYYYSHSPHSYHLFLIFQRVLEYHFLG